MGDNMGISNKKDVIKIQNEEKESIKVLYNNEPIKYIKRLDLNLDTDKKKCFCSLEIEGGDLKIFNSNVDYDIDIKGKSGYCILCSGQLSNSRIFFKNTQLGRIQSLNLTAHENTPIINFNIKINENAS